MREVCNNWGQDPSQMSALRLVLSSLFKFFQPESAKQGCFAIFGFGTACPDPKIKCRSIFLIGMEKVHFDRVLTSIADI